MTDRPTFENHEIRLPARPVPVAYLIDPLMARSWQKGQIGEPCRIDGEIDAGEVWKWTAKHRIARILGPLALAALVIPAVHSRPAEAQPAARTAITADVATVIQTCLQQFGYSVHIDGDYGPQTRKAVAHFQRANGLHSDGVAGPITRAAFANAGCGIRTAPTTKKTTQRENSSAPSGGAVGRWHDLAIQVGWTEAQWPTVACIIHRESRGQPNAHNSAGATGLMQILQRYHPGVNLYDPATNLRTGLKLYRLRGWQPWTAPAGVKDCF